ncbi:hypothetical protein FDI41_gp74 [Arthrobacter phage Piccoletto]|uniref:Uncharacterized protein n=1 Tax=Arthrobacter phage Piccoletto TaxID=2024282 RepID=A0A222Z9F1_9CAUD|nr:hypothetical protein FDI41_gp74 [Arthrobacter phage Piccoletto]ASR80704.1 hypothetical protein SEA_PICCOLETTO_74 [Arthrobacter phage Piccoletto]
MNAAQSATLKSLGIDHCTTGRFDGAGTLAVRWDDARGSWRLLLSLRGFVTSTQRRELAGYFTIVDPSECLRLS